ncbi:MAG: phosphatase PAP2 family protein [Actinomycetota bacterium]|nr:phosphatase PAP2 family protein [Actinomycetota bacterium]
MSDVLPKVVDGTSRRPRRRRRRPSGEAPPLPHNLAASGKVLIASAIGMILLLLVIAITSDLSAQMDRAEGSMLRAVAETRTPVLTTIMESLDSLGSRWTIGILRWGTILVLLAFKRFRHLFVLLGSLLIGGWITTLIAMVAVRARPFGVDIIGHWQGSSLPSRPVAAFAATLIGILYSLIVPGRHRNRAKWLAAALILLLCMARLYLGVDHPLDVIVGAILGVTIPIVAFRMLTPNEVFPVAYKRGRTAHLDVGGARGEAIKRALDEQLGIDVVKMKPFNLEGSGGSTPLLLTVADQPEGRLFAKLYAKNHLRADRWYKLGRTLLYGRLEDESSFSTVRRLVQYEDYMLRVMHDAGLASPKSHGFVEITPEREYLIVTDFVEGAHELLDADELDDATIDSALSSVRDLWQAGVAHRDIKPSNILVRGNEVFLIDVAFGQVRPSPWREAVDLANMMIVLALRSDPHRVYEHALRYFTPQEIAEGFAATRGVTMPSQSRKMLRKDRRDLVKTFRNLCPKRRPIAIQRWTWRRVGLSAVVLLATLLVVGIVGGNLQGAGLWTGQPTYSVVSRSPECGGQFEGEQMVLAAQSVPSATLLPCISALETGWMLGGMRVFDGTTEFFLDSDRAGIHAVHVRLTESCDVSGATEVPSDEPGSRRFENIDSVQGRYSGTRYYTFAGGCVRYRFDFPAEGQAELTTQISRSLDLESRSDLSDAYYDDTGLRF